MFAWSGIEVEDIQPAIGSCDDPDTILECSIWVEEVIVHTGYAIGTWNTPSDIPLERQKPKLNYSCRPAIQSESARWLFHMQPHILKVDAELMYTTFISYRLGEFKYKPN